MLGVRPSYKTGFAQWPGMSEYPQFWNGLAGAWDASLGPTGGKLLDFSGNNNHGVISGDISWGFGKYGSCLVCADEVSNRVHTGIFDTNFGQRVTISVNVKFDLNVAAATNRDCIIGSKFYNANDFMFEQHDVTRQLHFTVGDAKYVKFRIPVGDWSLVYWFHLILIYDSTQAVNENKVKFYYNGKRLLQEVFNGITNEDVECEGVNYLGICGHVLTDSFQGKMSHAIMWQRAFSNAEAILFDRIVRRLAI